jgi:hypothetical protein
MVCGKTVRYVHTNTSFGCLLRKDLYQNVCVYACACVKTWSCPCAEWRPAPWNNMGSGGQLPRILKIGTIIDQLLFRVEHRGYSNSVSFLHIYPLHETRQVVTQGEKDAKFPKNPCFQCYWASATMAVFKNTMKWTPCISTGCRWFYDTVFPGMLVAIVRETKCVDSHAATNDSRRMFDFSLIIEWVYGRASIWIALWNRLDSGT